MERRFRSVAFWIATIASTAFLLLVITATVWTYLYTRSHPTEHAISLAMTYGVLLIVAGSVFACVFFGWNHDRREVWTLRRQIIDLQFGGIQPRDGASKATQK